MAVWIGLLVLLASIAGGVAFAVVRAILMWRQFKRTGAALSAGAEAIARSAAQIEGQLQRASDAADRLRAVQGQLSLSRARLDVQLAAVREARTQIGRLLWFLPGR